MGTEWPKKFFLKDYFDAVIVCTGTYAEPYFPDIPGTKPYYPDIPGTEPYYPDIPGTKTINSTIFKGKIAKIVIFDQVRVNGGSNYE